ncbi:retrograde regulation protein 2, partial [Exophiala dermatitidis NIH/UT8656]
MFRRCVFAGAQWWKAVLARRLGRSIFGRSQRRPSNLIYVSAWSAFLGEKRTSFCVKFSSESSPNMGSSDTKAVHLENKGPDTQVPIVLDDQYENELLAVQLGNQDKEIKRILRKLDLRLVLTLSVLYLWAFIDRGNLANANIAGMSDDLGLTGTNRYSVLTMIFFIGYILIDAPASFIVRKIGAIIWIPSIVLAWGIVTIAQGFCHSWVPLLVCRIILGFLEGGLIPSAIFLISLWYTRYEAHKRLACFYVVGIASTGLSGLLAFGIENMDGLSGIAGWRWIFIIEGIATCFCAIVAYFTLVDLPDRATRRNFLRMPPFLTATESNLMHARIEQDRGDSTVEKVTFRAMLRCARDWKVWEFSAHVMLNNVALYAFAYFLPAILQKGLGYSTSKAQLFTFPPYAVAAPWILFCAWLCDRMKVRGPMMIFNSSLYIIGVSMTGFVAKPEVRYGGVFLGVMGITGNIPTNFAYQHNNVVGQTKRALCAALMTTGGGFGGIIAGNIFRAQDAPNYQPALIICLSFQILSMSLVVKNFFYFTWANRQADKGEKVIEENPTFRFTY